MKPLLKEEHGDERILPKRNGAGGRNGNRTAEAPEPEAQDISALRTQLAEKDAEIAALKQKLASYERQACIEGSSKSASPSKATGSVSTLSHSLSFGTAPFYPASPSGSSRAGDRAVQSLGGPDGSRAKPMEIDGSDGEVAAEPLRPGFARVHSSPPRRKKRVDLSDVIELTDSEPDVEIVAPSNASETKGKRRRKPGAGETKEEVAVKSENHVLSESSPRKLRKLNHAAEITQDEKPDMKPIDTEIPREFDLKRVPTVMRPGKLKSEPSKKEEELQHVLHSEGANPTTNDSQSSLGTQDSVVKQLANPKAEVKKELLLKDEDVAQLLAPAALRPYPVSLPEPHRSVTVTRDQLKGRFGGNTMETFPRPSAARIAQHGYDNFMCINLLWNPHGPQIPGHGGLFFETTVWPGDPWTANTKHSAVQVLFTRLAQGKWLYLGEYELSGATPLSVEQWDGMHETNRAIWPKEIAERNWGIPVRARIHLRQTLGREPTREEVEDAQGKFKNITLADVRAALDSGEESIQAWSMKCVGYNEDFQKEMVRLARGN
ncbi:hypothetical protein GSI_00099 [Ganoderma sinense ZZ0214-1]|uniref:DUF6697 domain-containing protein n=1 Tax=Ganoderma sinense ZZ0214-1 TaxID=1077348 RepID=A0A2G8SRK1_9APHY|nr:hypothetical protein GSI_00099 [Ganoderma sinense ZZ0214-1]